MLDVIHQAVVLRTAWSARKVCCLLQALSLFLLLEGLPGELGQVLNAPNAPLECLPEHLAVHRFGAAINVHVACGGPPVGGLRSPHLLTDVGDGEHEAFLVAETNIRSHSIIAVLGVSHASQRDLSGHQVPMPMVDRQSQGLYHKAAAQLGRIKPFLCARGVGGSADPWNSVGPEVKDGESSLLAGQELLISQANAIAALRVNLLCRLARQSSMLVHIPERCIGDREDAALVEWDEAKPQRKITVLLGI